MVYKEGEWKTVVEERREGSLVIIPIIIPWFKRRPNEILTPPAGPVAKEDRLKNNNRPPRDIGAVQPGYGSAVYRRKQPGKLNNGGNRGSRGQRNPNAGRGKKR